MSAAPAPVAPLKPVRRTTRLTPSGRIALPVAGASLLASWAFGGLLGLFASTSVAALVLALALTRWHLRGLRVLPPGPARVHVGDVFTPEVMLVAGGSFHGARYLRLACGEGDGFVEHAAGQRLALGPGERARVPISHRLHRRGRHHELQLVVASSFPMGLVEHRLHYRLPVEFLALPRLGSLGELGALPRARREPLHEQQPFERGEEEFYGVRDWREGESLRRVHWRLSARRGRRIVREYRLHAEPPVHLVLGTHVAGTVPLDAPRRRFERAVSLAATVAEHFLRRGRAVRLTLAGDELFAVDAARGRGGLMRVPTALADVGFSAGSPREAVERGLQRVPEGEVPIAVFVGDGSTGASLGRALSIDVLSPETGRMFLPARPWGMGEPLTAGTRW
ncbi:MAG: DUF58 domain-containing protein [Planctomycetota bacterium]